jgi:hypothetical protein
MFGRMPFFSHSEAKALALGPLNGNTIKSIGNNELGKCSCVIDYLFIDEFVRIIPLNGPGAKLWTSYRNK